MKLKKLISFFKPLKINKNFYFRYKNDSTVFTPVKFNPKDYQIKRTDLKEKSYFRLYKDGILAHKSTVFYKVHLMKTINKKKVPVIGDCVTFEQFRGIGLYPFMLNHISEKLHKKYSEICIIISPYNLPSIKGAEKSGFKKRYHIITTRIVFFYLSKIKTKFQ